MGPPCTASAVAGSSAGYAGGVSYLVAHGAWPASPTWSFTISYAASPPDPGHYPTCMAAEPVAGRVVVGWLQTRLRQRLPAR